MSTCRLFVGGSTRRPLAGRSRRRLLATALGLGLAACATAPTRFFTLSPLEASTGPLPGLPRNLAVGVLPIGLPDYLDRPQIVTAMSSTTMSLADLDSWVEPLGAMTRRMLVQDRRLLRGSDKVVVLPQSRDVRLDYQVGVDITRFDAERDGAMHLIARWTVLEGTGDTLLRDGLVTLAEPVPDKAGTDVVVEVMSGGWNRLAREIAKAIAGAAAARR